MVAGDNNQYSYATKLNTFIKMNFGVYLKLIKTITLFHHKNKKGTCYGAK